MACRLVDAKALSAPNAGTLLILTLERNFSEIISEIQTFSFKKMHLKICEMAAIHSQSQCVKDGATAQLYSKYRVKPTKYNDKNIVPSSWRRSWQHYTEYKPSGGFGGII